MRYKSIHFKTKALLFMLKNILKTHFNLQVFDYQLIKTIDTLVFKIETDDNQYFIAKLYKQHNQALVEQIARNAAFLSFIKTHAELKVQAPPTLHFPLIDWENEKRYLVLGDWIEGSTPKVKDAHFMEKMGAMMAQLHNAAADFKQKIAVLTIDNTLVQEVKQKILKHQSVLGFDEIQLNIAFQKIENTYKNADYTPSVFGLIHSDLHFENVIENGEDLSPIDFDEVAYGHYLLDIAITFNEIEELPNVLYLKKNYCIGYEKYRPLPTDFEAIVLKFQQIAGCIYLNWFLAEGNEALLLDKKLMRYAQSSLQKVLDI